MKKKILIVGAIIIAMAVIVLVLLLEMNIFFKLKQGFSNKDTKLDDNLYDKEFGSYSVPQNWIESKSHSTSNKFFYVNKEEEKNVKPNNISVNVGINKYKKSEHEKFRMAILNQLSMQIGKDSATKISASGSSTDNGYVLYTFTIKELNSTTVQYYIVGDYKYVLVHETIFDDTKKEEADSVAREIIDSFKWK